jgi:hydrogenase nickel incorporation protein HypA/HybF
MEIEQREILIRCFKCKGQSALEDAYYYVCPGCGSNEVEIIQGRELYLDYYEGEEN